MIYAATLSLTALMAAATRAYVKRNGLLQPGSISAGEPAWGPLLASAVFAISIPVALASPSAGEWCWLLLLLLAFQDRVFGR